MIRWIGLAPWEFEFPFPGSLTSTFLMRERIRIIYVWRISSGQVFLIDFVYHSTLGLKVIKKEKKGIPQEYDLQKELGPFLQQ